jgi:hypothetical protein
MIALLPNKQEVLNSKPSSSKKFFIKKEKNIKSITSLLGEALSTTLSPEAKPLSQ